MLLFALIGAVAVTASPAIVTDPVETSPSGVLDPMHQQASSFSLGTESTRPTSGNSFNADSNNADSNNADSINDDEASFVAATLDIGGGGGTASMAFVVAADDAPDQDTSPPATIVPSPGTLVLLSIGGLIAFRRSR